jgi:hypothetical protein
VLTLEDAVSAVEELARLPLPAVAVERVSVDQDDRLARALIFVVEVDGGRVLVSDGDVAHGAVLSIEVRTTVLAC